MTTHTPIKVWDPLVRYFHWILVVAFAIAFLTEDDSTALHVLSGYVIAMLLAIRTIWGVYGTRYARFSNFVTSPSVVSNYMRTVVSGHPRRFMGHNPAGGLMIVLMILMLTLVTISGLVVYAADDGVGPLVWLFTGMIGSWAEAFEEIHKSLANFTLLLVAVHVAGVMYKSIIHKENLVRAMWDGYKRK